MYHLFSYQRDTFFSRYNLRPNVETTFTMIKASFGDWLRSNSEIGQFNEVLCKVVAHNLCVLIACIYEIGTGSATVRVSSHLGCVELACRLVAGKRLYPHESWWSKFDRAQHHLEDLQRLVAPYAAGRPHPVTVRLKPHSEPPTWEYRVWFDGKPDQRWSLYAGDYLFDVRGALDHMMIALNPPKMKDKILYFPIYGEHPWLRQPGTRCYAVRDPTNRRNFTAAIRRIHKDAATYIKLLQPYAMAGESGLDANDHALLILKRLNNVDKHRRLLVANAGCDGAHVRFTRPDGTLVDESYAFPHGVATADGAKLMELPFEVDVEFMGSLSVGFGRKPQPVHEFVALLAIRDVIERHLLALEPYVPA